MHENYEQKTAKYDLLKQQVSRLDEDKANLKTRKSNGHCSHNQDVYAKQSTIY